MSRKIAWAALLLVTGVTSAAHSQSVSGSLRTRLESWNWFESAAADASYSYVGAIARLAVANEQGALAWRIEVAAPLLFGLPADAVAPPPAGQLGAGASYWQANDSSETAAAIFLKQAFVRFGKPQANGGHSLRAGRFEFIEGTETVPGNATLAAVKRDRIAHRLLGNFGWTHVQRSYDGVQYGYDRSGLNVTAAALRPTQGVFDVSGWKSLDVNVAYAALNGAPAQGRRDWRIFAVGYRDDRDDPTPLKVDNRSGAARGADMENIELVTLGAHYLQVWSVPSGSLDFLLWGVWQGGNWGALKHRANAFTVEAGLQPKLLPALKPWLRVGYTRSSGDDDVADDTHGTFFQMLPTPRIYARFPFYNMMNLEDLSVSLVLRPFTRLTLRGDAHRLSLTESADLWYAGGGAFEDGTFGYAGRPSNGRRDLATTFDAAAEFRLNNAVSMNGYFSLARGREVIQSIYSGRTARLGYFEVELRR